MSRENKAGCLGMSAEERRLIELIRGSEDPGSAMEKAAEVLIAFLAQPQSFEVLTPVDPSAPCEIVQ